MANAQSPSKSLLLALAYHKKLSWNVIPAEGKKPLINWAKYQKVRVSVKSLYDWFGKQFPEANVALVTGKVSGIIVIDVDNTEHVPEWLKSINTWKVKTHRGLHFYFKYDVSDHVKSFKVEDYLEVKAEGSIVILPESVHPSGVTYRWITFIKKLPKPAPFSLIYEYLKETKSYSTLRSTSNGTKLSKLYKGVPEGQRNVSLTRIAGSLLADGLNYQEVKEVLNFVNTRNSPPLPEKELESIIRSLTKKTEIKKRYVEKVKKLLLRALENDPETKQEFFNLVEEFLAEDLPEKRELLISFLGKEVFKALF